MRVARRSKIGFLFGPPPPLPVAMAESGRSEQIISQFLLKALHIVLSSRIPHLSGGGDSQGSSRPKKRDRWFNLALGDHPAVVENLNFWHRSFVDPMVIDVILCYDSDFREAVVERWVVQYESSPPSPAPRMVPHDSSVPFYKRTYKKSIVLLRSVYSILRLLPVYKAFRKLSSPNQSCSFSLTYKVSSFADPFSPSEEDGMKQHCFTPVETQYGQLSVSVTYRQSLSDFNLKASPLMPPRIIPDYVGSPAADPMRAFPSSLSSQSVCATSFPLRGDRSGYVLYTRPHSWTSPPMEHHPLNVSPNPVSELHAYSPDVSGRQIAAHRLHMASSTGGKNGNDEFNEYMLSPPFSPSPTPSPPLLPNSPLRNRMQSETAPVSIPPPTRSALAPPSPRSRRVVLPSQDFPSEGRSFRKIEGPRTGKLSLNLPGYSFQKGARDGKEESGFSSSRGSPRSRFSRNSSRIPSLDIPDDLELSFPFAPDDIGTPDFQFRSAEGKDVPEPGQPFMSSRKSQDAELGSLVQMLRSAPPLQGVGSSSFFMSRKASDALEELGSYKKMKDMLLSRTGIKLPDTSKQTQK